MTAESPPWEFERPLGRLRLGELTGAVDVTRPQLGFHELGIRDAAVDGELLAVSWPATVNATPISAATDRLADWPMKLSDAYVRGGDLVATYQHNPKCRFTPQLYWRAESTASPASANRQSSARAAQPSIIASLSLLVSVQTDLLDSHPRIRITTRLAAGEVVQVEPGAGSTEQGARITESTTRNLATPRSPLPAICRLWRLPGGEFSYAEIAPEGDVRDVSVEADADGMWCVRWELFSDFLEKGVIRRARLQSLLLPRERDIELTLAFAHAIQSRPLPLTT